MLPRFIYVIENNTIDRYMTKSCLLDSFPLSKIMPFSTADKAILSLKNTYEYPSLILVDTKMVDKDGWSFLDEYVLLKTYSLESSKVVMLTSAFNQEELARSKNYACVVDYIQRPVNLSSITSQVKAHFRQN